MFIYTLVTLLITGLIHSFEAFMKSSANTPLNEKSWWKYVKSSTFTLLILAYTYYTGGFGISEIIRNILVIGTYWLFQVVLTLTPDNLSWLPMNIEASDIAIVKDGLFAALVVGLCVLKYATPVGIIL